MQTWSLVSLCVLLGLAVRWGVSLNSYSGRKCEVYRLHAAPLSAQYYTADYLSGYSVFFTHIRVVLLAVFGYMLSVRDVSRVPINQTKSFFSSRGGENSHVWRLRGSKALARSDIQPPCAGMVSLSLFTPWSKLENANNVQAADKRRDSFGF